MSPLQTHRQEKPSPQPQSHCQKYKQNPREREGGWKITLKIPETIPKSSAQSQPALSSTSRGRLGAQWGCSMKEGGCAGNELWVRERCFRPAHRVGATGGDRESTRGGLKGLSPLPQQIPGWAVHPGQAQVRPSAGLSAPQGCRKQAWGSTAQPGERFGRCHPSGRAPSPGSGDGGAAPPPHSLPPLCHLCVPRGHSARGGSGGCRLPLYQGFALRMGRTLLTPAPAPERDARDRRSGAERCERDCPVKNAPPARTERHEAASRVGPVLLSQPRFRPR